MRIRTLLFASVIACLPRPSAAGGFFSTKSVRPQNRLASALILDAQFKFGKGNRMAAAERLVEARDIEDSFILSKKSSPFSRKEKRILSQLERNLLPEVADLTFRVYSARVDRIVKTYEVSGEDALTRVKAILSGEANQKLNKAIENHHGMSYGEILEQNLEQQVTKALLILEDGAYVRVEASDFVMRAEIVKPDGESEVIFTPN